MFSFPWLDYLLNILVQDRVLERALRVKLIIELKYLFALLKEKGKCTPRTVSTFFFFLQPFMHLRGPAAQTSAI